MQETEQIIALYHTGFIVCLCLTILFAVLSVMFFFVFKIRRVFDFITGRGEKRTVRMMEEENAKTGKLRQDYLNPVTSSDLYRTPSGSIPTVVHPITEQMNTGTEPTEQTYRTAPETGAGGRPENGSTATELLHTRADDGSAETELLCSENRTANGETTLLAPEMEAARTQAEKKSLLPGKFIIIKENIWIHTDELI